ncbi:MAG: hypothetical protein M3R08_05315, partial [Bacteroidota bacterium]|nr:hypothetical protein [Bacteroidota bacterium]
ADKELPRKADPIFIYTVEATVTDITGETQANNTSLSLGYKSIEIILENADAIDRSRRDSISIKVSNLNGERVDRQVDIKIHRLQAPALPLRDRKWEAPDRFVISAEAHAALFPFDPYNDENDPEKWERDSVVYELSQWNSREQRIHLANIEDWVVGPYLIELRTTDPEGNEVKVEVPITIYDQEIQNTGFLAEAFHVEPLKPENGSLQPGDKAKLLIGTALGEGRMGMEVERDGVITATRWFNLQREQQLIELPVLDEDRGGFAVHFIAVANGREFRTTQQIVVPWTNKELKVEWITFRDKMLPGSKEEFRLKINGPNGDKVASQLLATMYDASLDHFIPHAWQMFQWPQYAGTLQWTRLEPFELVSGQAAWYDQMPQDTIRAYPGLRTFGWPISEQHYMYEMMDAQAGAVRTTARGQVTEAKLQSLPGVVFEDSEETGTERAANGLIQNDKVAEASSNIPRQVAQPVRSDFRETAFFFPDLLTDKDGSVILKFTMPDALTRWKFLALAHTKDLKLAQFEREVITQKPLMVVPNLPRFLRQGDRITLISKINALEGDTINGEITMELFDPYTDQPIGDRFGLGAAPLTFKAAPGASGSASWTITIPEQIDLVGIRIMARSDLGITDGEEHVLPILSDRMLVTESLPISISKAGIKTVSFDKLKNSTSETLRHQSLKFEFTPNPAWYAVQALPYLTEYPHDCSEQVFSRYYANKIAAHIVEERPGILAVVEAWKASAEKGGTDLLSALEKNPELKSILLEETPWVMQARDERERKENIILLFDMERMAREEATSLKKLRELQRPDGSWPWFSGMFPSREITQYIVSGIGHLDRLGAADLQRNIDVQQMLERAIAWIDQDVDRWYTRLKKDLSEEEQRTYVPRFTEIQYLYARSFFRDRPFPAGSAQAVTFIQRRISGEWLKYGLQEQAMIALALDRSEASGTEVPASILRSLKERATRDEELGMYWKNFSTGMNWSSFPTETHAMLIEAFHEIGKDTVSVNELRQYLLKLKQTTDWRTTKATADACYALLLTGDDLLEATPAPAITIGNVPLEPAEQEAGTGYFAHTWSAEMTKPEMGEVSITSTFDRVAWGALHWQYFEQMDKITPHESPFNIRKQVMLRRQTEEGGRLLTLEEAGGLKLGDRLTIRIELRTDRYVDYVHLKDLRAAGLEPVEAISGYK